MFTPVFWRPPPTLNRRAGGGESDDEVDRLKRGREGGRKEGRREGWNDWRPKAITGNRFLSFLSLARLGADDDRLQIGSFCFLCSGPLVSLLHITNFKIPCHHVVIHTALTHVCSTST